MNRLGNMYDSFVGGGAAAENGNMLPRRLREIGAVGVGVAIAAEAVEAVLGVPNPGVLAVSLVAMEVSAGVALVGAVSDAPEQTSHE